MCISLKNGKSVVKILEETQPCPLAVVDPTVPAIEWPQNYSLDRPVNGSGHSISFKGKGKVIPGRDLDRTREFQEVEAPRFQDIRHKKVVRWSAQRTGRLYHPGYIPGTHFC
jgi:hypothetical protein